MEGGVFKCGIYRERVFNTNCHRGGGTRGRDRDPRVMRSNRRYDRIMAEINPTWRHVRAVKHSDFRSRIAIVQSNEFTKKKGIWKLRNDEDEDGGK